MRLLVVFLIMSNFTFAQESTSIKGKWLLTEFSAPDSLRNKQFEEHLLAKDFWMDIADNILLSSPCNVGASHYQLYQDSFSIETPTHALKYCYNLNALENYWFETIARSFIIQYRENAIVLKSIDGLYRLTFARTIE